MMERNQKSEIRGCLSLTEFILSGGVADKEREKEAE